MTLEEMKRSSQTMLLAKDVAPVLGSDQQSIRISAKMGVLPFPYMFSGNRLKIPRVPFLRWLGEIQ